MLLDYDIRTLSIGSGCVSLIFAAWLVYFNWRSARQSGFPQWVAAAALHGTGMTLLSFRDVLPDFFTIIVANACILLFFVFLYAGVERFNEVHSPFFQHGLSLVGIFTAGFLYFTYISHNINARIILISLAIAALSIYALTGLLREARLRGSYHAGPGIVAFAVLAAWHGFRSFYTLYFEPAMDNFMTAGFVHQVTFFVLSSMNMVVLLWVILLTSERLRGELASTNQRLQHALDEIKTLRGVVPICSSCKKIRNDEGFYESVEAYVTRHTEAFFSQSVCPDCARKLYPDVVAEMNAEKRVES